VLNDDSVADSILQQASTPFNYAILVNNYTALMFGKGKFKKAEDSGCEMRQNILLAIVNAQIPQVAKFLRRLVYQQILGRFPLLQLSALTISRAGFSVYYHTVKRRLKHYSWRFNDVPSASGTSPSETAPLKAMEARTYVRLNDIPMKADREVIRKKLRAINDEMEKKRGV
jgi:hypothetical protein